MIYTPPNHYPFPHILRRSTGDEKSNTSLAYQSDKNKGAPKWSFTRLEF